ncbi:Armadillo repeat-containing protein 1 [Larimichthys crocea]|uniref:Uncharacterized protein n=1 Tax=Larimichthys crocea TaxID=215358 RepID=A0ACD3RBX2_LARCR|nr:Armadillo repeat-containing protein 1 [Larimichthys crocea]
MSAEMDALAVVNQLRDLAADPLNRRAIVEDQGCLPGLILFLDHPNPQVVYSALLAGRFRWRWSKEYVVQRQAPRGQLRQTADVVCSYYRRSDDLVTHEAACRGVRHQGRPNCWPLRSMKFCKRPVKKRPNRPRQQLPPASVRPTSSWAPTTRGPKLWCCTSMDWMTPLEGAFVRRRCLKIRGVISFTFQMAVKRCVVRIRSDLKAEALGTAINSTKVMTAQQVVKTDDGGELMVPFQEDSEVLVEENTDIPDYLPEEESPSQEQDKAVTRVGSITDGMGWLSTAANFLTRSFYW